MTADMTDVLTETGRKLLREIARHDDGACFLIEAGRGRVALVVPARGAPGDRRRAFAVNFAATVRPLWQTGLIEVTERYDPVWPYAGRTSHLDSKDGRPVRITDTGRAALTGAQG